MRALAMATTSSVEETTAEGPFFYNYGINTVILRNRLRADGYVAEVDPPRQD
jgi:hypothetical protein